MATQKPTYLTLADFKAANDPDVKIPAKIRRGLELLLAEGKEAAEYETEFCRRAGIGPSVVGKYRDQFAKHIVMVRVDNKSNPKNVWFADPRVAAKARGEG
jgi:hypothetical protein